MNARVLRILDHDVLKSTDPMDKSITYTALVCDDYSNELQYVMMVQTKHDEDNFSKERSDTQSVDYEVRIYLPSYQLQSSVSKQVNHEEYMVYNGFDRNQYLEIGKSTLSRWMTLVEDMK